MRRRYKRRSKVEIIGIRDSLSSYSPSERKKIRSLIRDVCNITIKKLREWEYNDDLISWRDKVNITAVFLTFEREFLEWNTNGLCMWDGIHVEYGKYIGYYFRLYEPSQFGLSWDEYLKMEKSL